MDKEKTSEVKGTLRNVIAAGEQLVYPCVITLAGIVLMVNAETLEASNWSIFYYLLGFVTAYFGIFGNQSPIAVLKDVLKK